MPPRRTPHSAQKAFLGRIISTNLLLASATNIYGVDLAEFAVNLARIRLWLSLAVDCADGAHQRDQTDSWVFRLVPIYEGFFEHIHLFVMDPYDIALCKLKRDNDRDFQDVLFLARTTPFDFDLFMQRYRLAVSARLISLSLRGLRRLGKTENSTRDTQRFIETAAVRLRPADHKSPRFRSFGRGGMTKWQT